MNHCVKKGTATFEKPTQQGGHNCIEDLFLFSSGIEYIIIGERLLCANNHLKTRI